MSRAGSLTLVGTGIRLAGQLTIEALDLISQAERLFFAAGEAGTAVYLRRLNPAAETLSDCYREGRPRSESYAEMVARILQPVREGARVVAAFYGHPGVGVDPAHAAIEQARREGYPARMLPGISAEACLVADLGIDPLARGWQSYEAWRFLLWRPRVDPRSSLVLWQLGLLFEHSVPQPAGPNRRGLRAMVGALQTHYEPSHRVVLYEASPFPVCEPRVEYRPLRRLATARISSSTTLYVPPLEDAPARVRAARRR